MSGKSGMKNRFELEFDIPRGDSVAACEQMCEMAVYEGRDCMAFSYNTNQNTCWLYPMDTIELGTDIKVDADFDHYYFDVLCPTTTSTSTSTITTTNTTTTTTTTTTTILTTQQVDGDTDGNAGLCDESDPISAFPAESMEVGYPTTANLLGSKLSGLTPTTCATICIKNADCGAFAFNDKKSQCQLFTAPSANGYNGNPLWTFYARAVGGTGCHATGATGSPTQAPTGGSPTQAQTGGGDTANNPACDTTTPLVAFPVQHVGYPLSPATLGSKGMDATAVTCARDCLGNSACRGFAFQVKKSQCVMMKALSPSGYNQNPAWDFHERGAGDAGCNGVQAPPGGTPSVGGNTADGGPNASPAVCDGTDPFSAFLTSKTQKANVGDPHPLDERVKNLSEDQCARFCLGNIACVAYAYQKKQRACDLQKAIPTVFISNKFWKYQQRGTEESGCFGSEANHGVSTAVVCDGSAPMSAYAPNKMQIGYPNDPTPLGERTPAPTEEDCATACLANAACLAYAYNKKKDMCELQSKPPAAGFISNKFWSYQQRGEGESGCFGDTPSAVTSTTLPTQAPPSWSDLYVELTTQEATCSAESGMYDLTLTQCSEAVAGLFGKALENENGKNYGMAWPHGCWNREDGSYFYNSGGTVGTNTRASQEPLRVCGISSADVDSGGSDGTNVDADRISQDDCYPLTSSGSAFTSSFTGYPKTPQLIGNQMTGVNVEQCTQMCLAEPRCAGIIYKAVSNTCELSGAPSGGDDGLKSWLKLWTFFDKTAGAMLCALPKQAQDGAYVVDTGLLAAGDEDSTDLLAGLADGAGSSLPLGILVTILIALLVTPAAILLAYSRGVTKGTTTVAPGRKLGNLDSLGTSNWGDGGRLSDITQFTMPSAAGSAITLLERYATDNSAVSDQSTTRQQSGMIGSTSQPGSSISMKSAAELQYDMASALVAAMNDYAQVAGTDTFAAAGQPDPTYDMASSTPVESSARGGGGGDDATAAVPQVPPRAKAGVADHTAVNIRNSLALCHTEYLVPGVDTHSAEFEEDPAWDMGAIANAGKQTPKPAPRGNSLVDVWKSALNDSVDDMSSDVASGRQKVKSGAGMLAGRSVSNTEV